jgi:hypothetical protein
LFYRYVVETVEPGVSMQCLGRIGLRLERVHPATGTDKGAKSASIDALIGAAIHHNCALRDEAITILKERLVLGAQNIDPAAPMVAQDGYKPEPE